MTDIDQLLRSARPAVPDLPEHFSQSLVNRINSEGIEISAIMASSSPQRFRIGFGLVTWLTAAILFSYTVFELQMNGSLELLYFGTRFLGSFFGLIPWDLIVLSLLLTLFSAWLIKQAGIIKRSIAMTALVSYLITGIGGTALATTGFIETLQSGIEQKQSEWPWLALFHDKRAKRFIVHPNFKMGRVESVAQDTAFILTPHGEKQQIKLPAHVTIHTGQIVRISGEGDKRLFYAHRIHICNPSRVMHYFGHTSHHHNHHQKMMPDCCSSKQ